MRVTQSPPDLKGALSADFKAIEGIHTDAMRDLVTGFVGELRDDVEGAGLGRRLANTWRGKVFPGGGSSFTPAGFVWSKAAKIVGAFATGATILPTDGRRYLAIPTNNVPLKARGRRMTPVEVEATFNQDLIVRMGRGGRKLAFVNVIAAKNKRGFRAATKGRLAQGRQVKLVLMFILVPAVRIPKRIDPDATFQRWAGRYDALVQSRWDASSLGKS